MPKLTARKAESLKEPGHYVDGDGLALVIGKRGGKSWVLRTMVRGKRCDIGLGGYSWVSLAEAREKAREARKVAREGGDPIAQRKARVACPTFAEAARKVHADQVLGQGSNGKHKDQWINTLVTYAFPAIGHKSVKDVKQADVLAVLAPIWTEKAETARRVRQRIRTVMDWARTAGHYEGVNPVEGVDKGLTKQRDIVKHHKAMPWQEVPTLIPMLGDSVAALALRFLILTAARTGETIGAQWSEIDLQERLWIIPMERMKASREHRVPLTDEALAVLEKVRGLDEDFIFPGQKRGKGLSNMAMAQLLKRIGHGNATVHGFRSSFRDWAAERSSMPREIAELSLAHAVGGAVERAYRRSDLIEKRRDLMERWSAHCLPFSGHIIQLENPIGKLMK
ncbi:MAG: integrase arm-type DNA-binding domain-containing protein [Paracoccaceae bacterium]|jgi:integrase|nr:integrase arm-type DNA-binding domain-containing protein [Paracoccaceae bacterium]MDG1737894.1 integrase arm-type DNA-binding domain-containing protein [Paracoccaceae bacterium]MDG2259059.1 integrase arm-type DNA-binding domain-containing protein [Paracoccaceae bacterium]